MKSEFLTRTLRALWQRLRPYRLPLALSSALGFVAVRAILTDAGRPAFPLDDSFIHLVYAKNFASFRPFEFSPGDGFSSGATSFLWPLMLAPFHLLGMHGLSLIWAAWLLGTLLHAALALETYRLAEPLTGRPAALGAAAMSLCFGAFAWFAWSGMETIGLAWAITRTLRMLSEHAELSVHERTQTRVLALGAMGAVAPLIRPEGAPFALVVALGILIWPARPPAKELRTPRVLWQRLAALVPLVAVLFVPLVNYLGTGQARSNTAIVKWAYGNPYYSFERFWAFSMGNVNMLLTELLAGGPYTAVFLPEHSHYLFLLGALSLPVLAYLERKPARALAIALFALGTLIPCTFLTILWNRVRYIWPFAPSWFVLVACFGAVLERGLARYKLRDSHASVIVATLFAGALAGKLSWSIADLANSSRAIDAQQVKLGQWAAQNLAQDARIGVNDTGAIAYLSGRRTFDVVGLTTQGESRYWVGGSGSRYEHYERLGPARLPTHFIVYPQWMAIPGVLGERLFEATVTNQSILGGATKVAYVANYDVLGRAALPLLDPPATLLLDEVDVADLDSEAEHGYQLLGAVDTDNLVVTVWEDDGRAIADGVRQRRSRDRFNATLAQDKSTLLTGRFAAKHPLRLSVFVDGVHVGEFELVAENFQERSLLIPPGYGGKRPIEVRIADGQNETEGFGSLHYWLHEAP